MFIARLAQMVERMTLNHVVAGSIPAVGIASIVQWLEFVPSKHEVRVRFPVDACFWACGVMASTEDSESSNPGSNPGRPIDFVAIALVAQWIAHWTSNPEVAGSNPVKSI